MTATAEATGRSLRLPGGGRMGYAEFGDPAGHPVLLCHRYPGSRLQGAPLDQPARALGIRLISPDRPGMGLSTFRARRRILDYPEEIETLAVGLDLPRFGVLGVSGGTAYAAVLAHALPRVTALGLIAALPPLSLPDVLETLPATDRKLFAMARYFPWVAHRAATDLAKLVQTDSDGLRRFLQHDLPNVDADMLEQPDTWDLLLRDLREAFVTGAAGPAWETRLLARPWGFDLARIGVPIYLWHGEADKNVPIAAIRRFIDALPTCRATIVPDQGHYSILPARGADALAALGQHA
ncbi:MAG: alpha/beta hydrolase [Acidobacteriota bacterium]